MPRRGQSTVEPMLVLSGTLLVIALAFTVWHDVFQREVVARIATMAGVQVELP